MNFDTVIRRLKIGALVVALGAAGSFAWSVTESVAQTKTQGNSNEKDISELRAKVETNDAGVKVEIKDLRRVVDENQISTQKQLTDMQVTLQQILREAKRK